MSSSEDKSSRSGSRRRQYDSRASREALLEAAREVFDKVGYERATTREIGERAGVDPALIARYFDSKEGLFLAAVTGGEYPDFPAEPKALLAFLFERWDEHGYTPVNSALVSRALSEEMRSQISTAVRDRLEKQIQFLRDHKSPSPELRAELLVAIAVGVWMTRANRTLEGLAAAPREQLLEILDPLIDALESPPAG